MRQVRRGSSTYDLLSVVLVLYLAGGLKIAYDLLLYWRFEHHVPPEERGCR